MNGLLPAFRHTTLASLLLPIGKTSVWDQWSSREVALFESALCQYGKNFDTVANCVGSKSTHEVVEFYYVRPPLFNSQLRRSQYWKATAHKAAWKRSFKATEFHAA